VVVASVGGRMTIKLTLPYPPSANRYWRNYNGRMVVSDEARVYKELVAYEWLAQSHGADCLEGNVSLTLKVYRPRKSGDLSNRIKVLEDALNGLAYEDDSQVKELHAYRYDDKLNPRVEVEIEAVYPLSGKD
jgi:crossover junction endodeoxyribonuclease RusA